MLHIITSDLAVTTPVTELRCVTVTPDYYASGQGELAGWWLESTATRCDRSSYRYLEAVSFEDQAHAFEYHQGIVCPIRRFV